MNTELRCQSSAIVVGFAILLFHTTAFAVIGGQVDDFEDGSTQGWGEGTGGISGNPNPPTNESTGGPDGANDNFLQNVSSGGIGSGSRQVIFNSADWSGDFTAANVVEIRFQAKVIAGTQASFRVAFQSVAGTRFSSTNAVVVTNDGAWHEVVLPVLPENLTNVGGLETAEQVLATVSTTRILSAAAAPSWQGDSIVLTVGYDNIMAVEAPVSFQGWLWSNSVGNDLRPELFEESCFGHLVLNVAGDDTWVATSPNETCWGRFVENFTTPRDYFNFDGTGFPVIGGFETRSTQPLVNAGGNLVELYGEDVSGGVGQGEARVATVLATPSDSNFLMAGGFQGFEVPGFTEAFSFVHLLVKSSPAVNAARTAADLEGRWRITFFERSLNRTVPTIERSRGMVHTIDLQAAGACAFVESDVFQETDVNTNGDYYNIVISDLDATTNLTNQRVNAAVFDRSNTNCTYSIDGNGNLVLAYTQSDVGGVVARTEKFAVSDDNNYLVATTDAIDANSSNALMAGYRSATAMSGNALDGNFLFYLNLSEYEATGTGHSSASTGVQQFDGHGRGLISFDSTVQGTVPPGQTGNWRSCSLELVIDDAEYQVDGDPSQLQVTTAMSIRSEPQQFSSCDYKLNADGAVLVSLGLGPGESALFAGYADNSGEVLSLVNFFSDPEPDIFSGEDQAAVRHILGMKYLGDPDGNEDGDQFSNKEEFFLPLPPAPPTSCSLAPLPAICSLPDLNGNGSPDIAIIESSSPTHVFIRDGSDDSLISDINFGVDTAHAMSVLPDLDSSGSMEIAVLNTQASNQVRVQVRDSVSGNLVRNLFYGAAYSATTMRILDDYDGNGAPEIAVMGSDGTGAIRVQIKDADTTATLDNVFLGNQGVGKDFVAVADTSGNSMPELGILSVLNGNDQVRTQVWDSVDATFQTNVWFGKVYQPFKLITMPDINGNGSDEIVAVGVDPVTQNIRVQVRDSASTATHFNIWLGNTNDAVDIALINDINNDGMPDLAVLLQTPTGTGRVRVQSGLNGAFIRNLFYTGLENPVGLAVMPDYNDSGHEELAVAGDNAGLRHVQILDTSSGQQVNRIDYP